MQTNLCDFAKYKQRFDTTIICIGDCVEWQDFDGTVHEGVVAQIESKDAFEGEKITNFPMWEKHEYIVDLDDGLSISGDVIVRKIVKRQRSNATIKAYN